MSGVGQGLNEGIRMAGGFLSEAMKRKQQDKQFYDKMAADQAWMEGMYGSSAPTAPQAAPPHPSAGPSVSPHPMPAPAAAPSAQATIRPMPMTPAQSLLPAPPIVAKPAREFMPSTLSASRQRWPR